MSKMSDERVAGDDGVPDAVAVRHRRSSASEFVPVDDVVVDEAGHVPALRADGRGEDEVGGAAHRQGRLEQEHGAEQLAGRHERVVADGSQQTNLGGPSLLQLAPDK
jgi:hypothetical protein